MVAGGHGWLLGDVHGWWREGGGMHSCGGVCVLAGGHVWLRGACMVVRGAWLQVGVHGCGGHAWLWGMHGCGGHAYDMMRYGQ